MTKLKVLLLGVGGLVPFVPGLKAIVDGAGTPPGSGRLFGGTVLACGAFVLLCLLLFRKSIARTAPRRAIVLATTGLLTFLVLLTVYLLLLGVCTVEVDAERSGDPSQEFYLPLWTTGDLADAIAVQGSRQKAADRYRRALPDWLRDQGVRLPLTTALLLVLYAGSLAALTLSFGFLGFRVEAEANVRVAAPRVNPGGGR